MDGDRSSLSLRRSYFYSCSHHAACLVNIEQTLLDVARSNIHFHSLSFSLTLDFACQISIIIAHYTPEFFFAPDKHTWAIVRSHASYFHVSVFLGFTLYLVWYLFTTIPTLIVSVSISYGIGLSFWPHFSVRHFISFPPIINSFPTHFRFF